MSIVGRRVKVVGDEESKIDCEVIVVFVAELVVDDVVVEEVVKACNEVASVAGRPACEEFWPSVRLNCVPKTLVVSLAHVSVWIEASTVLIVFVAVAVSVG